MAIALVQNKAATGAAGTTSVTLNAAATAGNLLVFVAWTRSATLAAMTPPAGFSDRIHRATTGSGGVWLGQVMIASKIAAGGETTLSCAASAGVDWEAEAYEFSGITQQGGEFDNSISATSATVSVTSEQPGSITPATSGEVFIVAQGLGGNGAKPSNGGTEAIGSSFIITDAATFSAMITGYKIKADALAENPSVSWFTSGFSIATQAAFQAVLIPNAPSGLSASPITATRIDLSWTASAADVTHDAAVSYKIERAPDVAGSPGTFAQIASGNVPTSYSDTTLAPNTKYWYRVRATNVTGDGGYSGNATATTLAALFPPRQRGMSQAVARKAFR